jgi:hypothetical protein
MFSRPDSVIINPPRVACTIRKHRTVVCYTRTYKLTCSNEPAEICREIRGISEASTVTRHQVYYLWQKANAKMWQRDSDPLVSATMLLSENCDHRDHYAVFVAGNVRALGFFVRRSIESLASSARRQFVMDSTFGTNNSGSDLFV